MWPDKEQKCEIVVGTNRDSYRKDNGIMLADIRRSSKKEVFDDRSKSTKEDYRRSNWPPT